MVVSYTPTAAAIAGRQAFGLRVRSLREAQGVTQERLALDAGLDRSFLADVESGRHSILLDRVYDLAAALKVDVSALLTTLDDTNSG